ncbi:MAG: AsmA family protein [Hyphomicrobiaceae bacterium]
MNRFLLSSGAFVVCILAALFAMPQFIDWTYFRGVFEEEASRQLGRQVLVGGDVNLELLPTPYIRFDQIRIADGASRAGQSIFKADGFIVWLKVSSLFKGVLEATRVELTRPVLTLAADSTGGGNWTGFGDNRPASVLSPGSIALNTVHITDGAVVVRDANGKQATFEAPTAELSASTLDGSYRLLAMLTGAREFRLSTAKPETDGSVRFKAVLRALQSGESYSVDGQLVEPTGKVRITGEFAASLPVGGADGTGGNATTDGGAHTRSGLDIRASLKADTREVSLSNLSLSFDSQGRPQLATGEAQFGWDDAQPASVRLESRWLDLDRIAGGGSPTSPLPLLEHLTAAVDKLMPAAGRTQVTFAIDQANLGGEAVSGLQLMLEKDKGVLKLGHLRAGLPGGARIDANGALATGQADRSFSGDVTLRGASINRFLAWAAQGYGIPALMQDGSFAVRGNVSMGPGQLAGRGLMFQVAGNSLSGEMSWRWRDQQQIRVSVEGPELDVTPLLGENPRLGNLVATALRGSGADPAATHSEVHVRAGRVVAGQHTLRDVSLDFAANRDTLGLPLLKFSTDDDLTVELNGAVTGLAGNRPKGSIGGQFSTRLGGLDRLADILGVPQELRPSLRRADALTPLKLAGNLVIGAQGMPAYDLSLDGMTATSRLTVRASLDDARGPWREQRVNLSATLDGAEVSTVLAQVLPDMLAGEPARGAGTPAVATLRAIGVPARGLASLLTFDAAGIGGEFRGRVAIDDTAGFVIDGETRLTADDLGRTATLMGSARRQGLEGVPVQATLGTSLDGGTLKFEARQLVLAGLEAGGQVSLELGSARKRSSGRLHASEVNVPRLLAMLADSRLKTEERKADRAGDATPWPEAALDLSALADVDIDLRVNTPTLRLVRDMVVTNAQIEVKSIDGKLNVQLRNADALGGKAEARLEFSKVANGIFAQGEMQLVNARLERFGSPNRPAAIGDVSFGFDFNSVGLSPRGLVSAARGKGQIALGRSQLNRLSPGAINTAALAALVAPGETLAAELRRKLDEGLGNGVVALGPRNISIALADGTARLEPVVIETPDGRATGSTTIDAETMAFDSEWRIEPKPAPARGGLGKGGALPGISIVYVGPLASLGTAEPKLQTEALERELSVRKIERYVDELERLRHSDEERVKLEAERTRALEVERQRIEEDRLRALRRSDADATPRPGGSGATTTLRDTVQGAANAPASKARPPTAVEVMRGLGDRAN